MSSFCVSAIPAGATLDRVAQANTMKELLELIPIHVRPAMADICEKCYRISHKISTAGVQLDELKQHTHNNTFPPKSQFGPTRSRYARSSLGKPPSASPKRRLLTRRKR